MTYASGGVDLDYVHLCWLTVMISLVKSGRHEHFQGTLLVVSKGDICSGHNPKRLQ